MTDETPADEPERVAPSIPSDQVGRSPEVGLPFASGDHVRLLVVSEDTADVVTLQVVLIAIWPWGVEWQPADDRGHTLTPWHYVVSLDVP